MSAGQRWSRHDDELREFQADVEYAVWRRGGNMDRIDYDRLTDCYYEQHDPEACASQFMPKQEAPADITPNEEA